MNIQEQVNTKPSDGPYKIFILYSIDAMNTASANKLLKTLEEPPPYVLFFLTSNHPYNVLPTIRSRCQTVRFSTLDDALVSDYLRSRFGLIGSVPTGYPFLPEAACPKRFPCWIRKMGTYLSWQRSFSMPLPRNHMTRHWTTAKGSRQRSKVAIR